jgi:hypothetical protein
MFDVDGHAHKRLGLVKHGDAVVFLVRPDGHIGYRPAGHDLHGVRTYLDHWLPGCEHAGS